jgi:hypothetical protein
VLMLWTMTFVRIFVDACSWVDTRSAYSLHVPDPVNRDSVHLLAMNENK